MTGKLTVHFGTMADPIAVQLPNLDVNKAKLFQADVDAISRLRVRGLIPWKVGDRAYEKLAKMVLNEASRHDR